MKKKMKLVTQSQEGTASEQVEMAAASYHMKVHKSCKQHFIIKLSGRKGSVNACTTNARSVH
jgi:hypothetical protein